MKLTMLIVLGLVWGVFMFLAFEMLPRKTDKTWCMLLLIVAFFVVSFGGVFGIYKLGVLWMMESQAKRVLGVVGVVLLIVSFVYNRKGDD